MPGNFLHLGATVQCAHVAPAQPLATNPRVQVSGQPIVTQSNNFSISGCPFVTGGTNSPCVNGQWTSASLRVTASGNPVVLTDSQSVCTPNGTPLQIVSTQTRVTAQ